MARTARAIGGPRDGEVRTWSRLGEIWDARWGDEWYAYQLESRSGRSFFRYLGDDAHRCLSCFAIVLVPREDPCPLCGAEGEKAA